MNYKTMTHTLAGSLALLAAASFAPAAHAIVATSPYTLESTGTISLSNLSLTGPTTLEFIFGPGVNFAPAELVASNFTYMGNWSVNTAPLLASPSTYFVGHESYTYTLSPSAAVTSVTLYNNGAPSTITPQSFLGIIPLPPLVTSPDDGKASQTQTTSSVTLPFSSIGSGASFDFAYYDAPTSATFSLLLGQTTLVSGNFSPSGTFTPTSTAAGVSASFTPLTPAPAATVPEASDLAMLGLGALPLLGLTLRARRRAARA